LPVLAFALIKKKFYIYQPNTFFSP